MMRRICLGLEAALSHDAQVVPLSNAFGQVTGLPTWLIFGITWQSLNIQHPERRPPPPDVLKQNLCVDGDLAAVFLKSPQVLR